MPARSAARSSGAVRMAPALSWSRRPSTILSAVLGPKSAVFFLFFFVCPVQLRRRRRRRVTTQNARNARQKQKETTHNQHLLQLLQRLLVVLQGPELQELLDELFFLVFFFGGLFCLLCECGCVPTALARSTLSRL